MLDSKLVLDTSVIVKRLSDEGENFLSLLLQFIPENETRTHETYQLADQLGTTYHDASFLSLAQELDATLVTDNPRHQAKTLYTIKITPLGDYPLDLD